MAVINHPPPINLGGKLKRNMIKFQTPNIRNYKIALDNIKTIDDVIAALKALDITFHIDTNNITPNQKEAISNGVIIPVSVDKQLLN